MGNLNNNNQEDEILNANNPSINKKSHQLSRVIGIDFTRGWGLFIVVVTHTFNFWAMEYLMNSDEAPDAERPLILTILMFPFLWQATWASIFALLTGASAAFTIHSQLSHKNVNLKKRIKKTLINNSILLILNFIYNFLAIYPVSINGNRFAGLIPASIGNGTLTIPPKEILFIASPLSMILLSNLFVSFTCYIFWRKGIDKTKKTREN